MKLLGLKLAAAAWIVLQWAAFAAAIVRVRVGLLPKDHRSV